MKTIEVIIIVECEDGTESDTAWDVHAAAQFWADGDFAVTDSYWWRDY